VAHYSGTARLSNNSKQEQPLNPQMKNSFFDQSGMPKFGKHQLDNFIKDPELQQQFVTSEVVRNALMLQCVYIASVHNDLLQYKHAQLNQAQGQDSLEDCPPFTVGIIGCGQVGTMILTKLLEAQSSFNNLRLVVSTR
jgi:hypothetical protein